MEVSGGWDETSGVVTIDVLETESGKYSFRPDRPLQYPDEETDNEKVVIDESSRPHPYPYLFLNHSNADNDDVESETKDATADDMDNALPHFGMTQQSDDISAISATSRSILFPQPHPPSIEETDGSVRIHEEGDGLTRTVTNTQVIVYLISVWIYLIGSIVLVPEINDGVLSGILFTIGSIGFCYSDAAEMWKQGQYPVFPVSTKDGDEALINDWDNWFIAISTSERFSFKHSYSLPLPHASHNASLQSNHRTQAGVQTFHVPEIILSTSDESMSTTTKTITNKSAVFSITSRTTASVAGTEMRLKNNKPNTIAATASPLATLLDWLSSNHWFTEIFLISPSTNSLTIAKTLTRLSFTGSLMFLVGSVLFIFVETITYGVYIFIAGSIIFTCLSSFRIYEAGCHGDQRRHDSEDDVGGGEGKSCMPNGRDSDSDRDSDSEPYRDKTIDVSHSTVSHVSHVSNISNAHSQVSPSRVRGVDVSSISSVSLGSVSVSTSLGFLRKKNNIKKQHPARNVVKNGSPSSHNNSSRSRRRGPFQLRNLFEDGITVIEDVCSGCGALLFLIGCVFYLPNFIIYMEYVWAAWVLFMVGSLGYIISACLMTYKWFS